MILRSAQASGHLAADVMAGCAPLAPRARPERLTDRLLPSVHEVFDLADAIATLGPRMTDGFPCGERFRTLVLCAGTAGGRPGELVATDPTTSIGPAPGPAPSATPRPRSTTARPLTRAAGNGPSSTGNRATPPRTTADRGPRRPATASPTRLHHPRPHLDQPDRHRSSRLGKHHGELLAPGVPPGLRRHRQSPPGPHAPQEPTKGRHHLLARLRHQHRSRCRMGGAQRRSLPPVLRRTDHLHLRRETRCSPAVLGPA